MKRLLVSAVFLLATGLLVSGPLFSAGGNSSGPDNGENSNGEKEQGESGTNEQSSPRKKLQEILQRHRSRISNAPSGEKRKNEMKKTLSRLDDFLQKHGESGPAEDAQSKKASLLNQLDRPDEAQEVLQTLIVKYADSTNRPSYYLRLGDVLLKQDKFEKSRSVFEKIRKQYPDQPEATATHLREAYTYEEEGKYEAMNDKLKKTVSTGRKQEAMRARFLLGQLQAFRGNRKKARNVFQELLDNADDDRLLQTARREIQQLKHVGREIKDLSGTTLSGNPLPEDLFDDHAVLLFFWASWSKPSYRFLDELQSLYETYADRGLRIVGVTLDTDEQALRRLLKEKDISWPQIYDGKKWETSTVQEFQIRNIPRFYLLDRSGTLRHTVLRPPMLVDAVKNMINKGDEEK